MCEPLFGCELSLLSELLIYAMGFKIKGCYVLILSTCDLCPKKDPEYSRLSHSSLHRHPNPPLSPLSSLTHLSALDPLFSLA